MSRVRFPPRARTSPQVGAVDTVDRKPSYSILVQQNVQLDVTVHPWGDDPEKPSSWDGCVRSIDDASTEWATLADVDEVVAQFNDDADEYDGECAAVVRLKDGRFMSWATFWGPTGDGFHEDAYGGDAEIFYAPTLEAIQRWALTAEHRRRLGLALPEDA